GRGDEGAPGPRRAAGLPHRGAPRGAERLPRGQRLGRPPFFAALGRSGRRARVREDRHRRRAARRARAGVDFLRRPGSTSVRKSIFSGARIRRLGGSRSGSERRDSIARWTNSYAPGGVMSSELLESNEGLTRAKVLKRAGIVAAAAWSVPFFSSTAD